MADKTTTAGAVASPEETAAYRSELDHEWGTFVATQAIAFNGVPAYNPGDSVPTSNVEKYGYEKDGLVARVAQKAGKDFIASLHEANTAAAQPVVYVPVSLGVPVPESK